MTEACTDEGGEGGKREERMEREGEKRGKDGIMERRGERRGWRKENLLTRGEMRSKGIRETGLQDTKQSSVLQLSQQIHIPKLYTEDVGHNIYETALRRCEVHAPNNSAAHLRGDRVERSSNNNYRLIRSIRTRLKNSGCWKNVN